MNPGDKVRYTDAEIAKNPGLKHLEGVVKPRGQMSGRFARVRWRGFSDDDWVAVSKLVVIG